MPELERARGGAISSPARIALVYLVVSIGWIVVTDRVAEGLGADAPVVQTLKGSLFVVLSAALIWWLVRRDQRRRASLQLGFEAIADQEVVGIFIARGDRMIYVNPMLSRILGMPREALLALPASRLLEAIEEEPLPSGPSGGAAFRRVVVRRDDGTTLPLHVLRRSTGAGGGTGVGIVLDASPVEELENRLRQTAKLEALGQVTGSVAHDFNNLLTGMIGQLDLALMDLPNADLVRADLAAARDTARRAAVITGQLLTFSRSRVSRSRSIDVNAAVRELGGLLGSLCGPAAVIQQELEEPLPPILLDPGSFDQMLVNLVVNARQALERGGGVITVRTRAVTTGGERRVAVEVEDTGIGIPPRVVERMLEPFFTTKEHGTGLGLSTVKSIVDQGRGSLEVQSQAGRGTTMRVLFPATEEPPVSRQVKEPPAPEKPVADRTVLVVDDEPAVRKVIAAALRRRGYRVLDAAEGDAARERFLGEDVGLVISDVLLPGRSGVELARELIALRPDLKVLLITGYTPRDLVEHDAELADFPFLEKPFSVDELTSTVDRLWREGHPGP